MEIALRNKRNAQFLEDGIWEQIEELSDQGEGFADLLLHFKYYSMGTQNEVAIKYLKRSIQKYDSPISYLQLGICYGWGLGVPLNDVLAKRNYEKAMEKGCGIACRYLGQLYRYGGVKVEKDIVKAEEYLRKGVGMGVAECYEQLFWLYFEIGEDKKAKDLAQQMIDYNIKGGYSLMGNYYSSTFNQNQAEDWYKEAAKREENNAWGNLAWMYLQHGDKDEAYRLADKGCSENDSFSFQMLGHLCKIDGELNKAWSYFHQSILKFGTGQYGLAELYFDSNYLPEGYTLSELKHELEQSARKQDMKSIEYTLRLILLENKKDCANISYDSLKDLPDSYEFIRLGAKEGDANCLYILGRLLIESEGKMHNPFKGIDNIMSALEKGNKEASEYLFNTRSNLRTTELSRLYQDIVKNKAYVGKETATVIEHYGEYDLPFIEWLYRSLKNLVWDDTNVFFDCFIVFRKALEKTKSQIEVKNWLDMQIEEFVNGFDDKTTSKLCTPFYAYLLATRLSIADEIDNGTILSIIRDVIKIYEDIEFVSKIHYFKDTVQLIWPDYRADKILDGDFSSNRDLWIFYGINNRSIPDVLVGDSSAVSEINDYFGQYVHLPFEMHGLNVTKSKKFLFAYTKMTNCYQKLKDTRKVLKLEESDYRIRKTSVCCSIGDTLNYCINSFKMLVVSRNAFSKQWQDIVDNLDDPEHLHNIANTVKNINARNLLYSYLDLISARDELLMFDIQLEHCISNAYISDTINAMIFELEINKIQHSIPRMTEDGIPESIKEMKDAMRTFAGTLRHYLTA